MVLRIAGEGSTSAEAGWIQVGTEAELPPGTAIPLTVGDVNLTLVNADGRVVAIGGVCLRCSRSFSTAGYARGVLTCAGCGWKYNVRDGCVEGLPNLQLEVHQVHVADGRLMVDAAIAAPAGDP